MNKKNLSKNLFFKCFLRRNKLIETYFSEPRNKNSLDFVKKKKKKFLKLNSKILVKFQRSENSVKNYDSIETS